MLAQHYRRMRHPRLYRRERNAAIVVPCQLTPTELRFERALTGPAKKVSELKTLAAREQQSARQLISVEALTKPGTPSQDWTRSAGHSFGKGTLKTNVKAMS